MRPCGELKELVYDLTEHIEDVQSHRVVVVVVSEHDGRFQRGPLTVLRCNAKLKRSTGFIFPYEDVEGERALVEAEAEWWGGIVDVARCKAS